MGDIGEIVELFESSIRQICAKDYSTDQIEAWVTKQANSDRWTDLMKDQYVVIAEEKSIAGFGSLKEDHYIDMLYVHPDFQNQGVASKICDKLLESRSNKTKALKTDASEPARPFFERKGFVVETKNVFNLNGVEIHNYRMTKTNA